MFFLKNFRVFALGSLACLSINSALADGVTGSLSTDRVDPAECDPGACDPVTVCPIFAHSASKSVIYDDGTFGGSIESTKPLSGFSLTPTNHIPLNEASTINVLDPNKSFIYRDSGGNDNACAILDSYEDRSTGIITEGVINCSGSTLATTSVPSGGEPYVAVAMGTTGRFAALDKDGCVVVWGNTAGAFNSGKPTTCGFTALAVGRDAACASGITNGGVTCWGADSQHLSVSSSIPTTGTYTDLEVARYTAGAVKSDGTVVYWGTDNSAYASQLASFIANAPTSGVKNISFVGDGYFVGAAWRTDKTEYLWQQTYSSARSPVIDAAPGWLEYGGGNAAYYVPRGPEGEITWRSPGRFEIYTGNFAAVVEDGKGSEVARVSGFEVMEYGDAFWWSSTAGEKPHLISECYTSAE